jgi:hypothetical protein
MESILYSVDDFSAFLWEDSIKELITADDRSSDTDSNTVDTSGVGESQPYTNTEVEFQEPLKRFLDGNWQTGNSPNSSTISVDILFPETLKNYVMLPVRNLDAWTDTSVVREIEQSLKGNKPQDYDGGMDQQLPHKLSHTEEHHSGNRCNNLTGQCLRNRSHWYPMISVEENRRQ